MSIDAAVATMNAWLMDLMPEHKPALDEKRQVQFASKAGPGCNVHLTSTGEEVVFYVDLMKLVRPMQPKFYEDVLSLNAFGDQPYGGALSFDKFFNTLVYFHRAALEDLTSQKFANIVGNFTQGAAAMQEKLAVLAAQDQLGSPATTGAAAIPAPTPESEAFALRV